MEVKIESHVDEVKKNLEDAVQTALDAVGMQAASYAKQNLNGTPHRIDTGLLLNSITWAVSGKPPNTASYKASNPKPGKASTGSYSGQAPDDPKDAQAVYIGTNVEYAIYVHEGTSRMAPNHFLKNAITDNRDVLKAILEKFLKDA